MLSIEFKTSNAAFHEEYAPLAENEQIRAKETVRILKGIVNKIEAGYTNGSCIDINGNNIGEWELTWY